LDGVFGRAHAAGWDGVETARGFGRWLLTPIVICTAYSDYSWDDMRARWTTDSWSSSKAVDNVEVQQLAHAMKKVVAQPSSR